MVFVKNNPVFCSFKRPRALSAGLFHKLCLTEMTEALETLVTPLNAFHTV